MLTGTDLTYFEGKRIISLHDHIHKLVATTVACSFTSHNNNSDSNALIPTILMNHNTIHACLYDCVCDVLLISEAYHLFEIGQHGCRTLSPSACLFIWIMVNHRYFLGSCTVCIFSVSIFGLHSKCKA